METKTFLPVTVMTAEFTVSIGNYPQEAIDAVDKMYAEAACHGMTVNGCPYWNHLDCTNQPGVPYVLQVALPVTLHGNYSGEFNITQLPGTKYTGAFHQGPFENMYITYQALVGQTIAGGHQLKNNFRELYLNFDTSSPDNHLVYIMAEIH